VRPVRDGTRGIGCGSPVRPKAETCSKGGMEGWHPPIMGSVPGPGWHRGNGQATGGWHRLDNHGQRYQEGLMN